MYCFVEARTSHNFHNDRQLVSNAEQQQWCRHQGRPILELPAVSCPSDEDALHARDSHIFVRASSSQALLLAVSGPVLMMRCSQQRLDHHQRDDDLK